MENIFEGARFGDKFVCRNGMQAVLLSYELITPEPSPTQVNTICLCAEDGYMDSEYNIDGTLPYDNVSEYEIVSRYQEPHGECNNNPNGCISSICPETCSKFIDEDRLNELAENHVKCFDFTIKPLPNERALAKASFKAGYRKAKEW